MSLPDEEGDGRDGAAPGRGGLGSPCRSSTRSRDHPDGRKPLGVLNGGSGRRERPVANHLIASTSTGGANIMKSLGILVILLVLASGLVMGAPSTPAPAVQIFVLSNSTP